jgi:hypothetical protein
MAARLALSPDEALERVREQNRRRAQRYRASRDASRGPSRDASRGPSRDGLAQGAAAPARAAGVGVVVEEDQEDNNQHETGPRAWLCGHGVLPAVAARLVATHDAEAISQQVAWLAERRCTNPPGALVRAIEQGWGPPVRAVGPPVRPEHRNRPPEPPPLPELPVVGPESDAARERVKAALQARGVLRQYAQIGQPGGPRP